MYKLEKPLVLALGTEDYSYPIDYELFSQEEIITLIEFFSLIEDANEGNVNKKHLLEVHSQYRKILNSMSLEKQMDKEFEKISGYSIYQTLQNLK